VLFIIEPLIRPSIILYFKTTKLVIINIYIILFTVRSVPLLGHADYSLFKEKLIKENLGLTVLDTHVKRQDNVTPASHIYSLCSPHASGNL
jgi:hypothetical protein